MDTLPYRHHLDQDTAVADLPSSQDTGTSELVDKKSTKICKSAHLAHSPSIHSRRDTRDAKGQRKPPEVDDNSQEGSTISEEQENGKLILEDGSAENEEALRALKSYAAFQVALLRCLADDSTFNEQPGQILFPNSVFQSGPPSEPSMSRHTSTGL